MNAMKIVECGARCLCLLAVKISDAPADACTFNQCRSKMHGVRQAKAACVTVLAHTPDCGQNATARCVANIWSITLGRVLPLPRAASSVDGTPIKLSSSVWHGACSQRKCHLHMVCTLWTRSQLASHHSRPQGHLVRHTQCTYPLP